MAFRWFGGSVLAVVVLLGLSTAPGVAASPAVNPTADLFPSLDGTSFLTGGRSALYTARWENQSKATLTNVLIVITLPAGSVVRSVDPDVCAPPTGGPSDPVVLNCPRDNLRSGETFTQQVFFQVPVVTTETPAAVDALLKGDERTSDIERAHTDTFPQKTKQVRILPAAADQAGGCLTAKEATLATQSGLSAANPLITTASLAGPTSQICTPMTLAERHPTSPTDKCGAGATCTTDIARTVEYGDGKPAPAPPVPIQLTFTFLGNNKNLTWYKTGDDPEAITEVVPSCPGATQLPDNLAACVNSRAKAGSMAITLGVLWRGGTDPYWVG